MQATPRPRAHQQSALQRLGSAPLPEMVLCLVRLEAYESELAQGLKLKGR